MDLAIIALATGISAAVVGLTDPPDAARIPLMLPFALFAPGYSLTAALYPRRDDLEPLERLALSFGLSLAVLPLIALALNYGPWGVRWEPLLAFVALLVVLACSLGLLHRRLVPAQDRFSPSLRLDLTGGAPLGGLLHTVATLALLAPIAALAAVLLVLLAAQRSAGQPHTEFYLLPSGGPTGSLPRQLTAGQQTSLTIGIRNREDGDKLYGITALVNGAPIEEVAGLRLGPGQGWQGPFTVTLEQPGNRQLLQFDLHVNGASRPTYRTLYIWVDVLEPLAAAPVEVLAQAEPPAPAPTATPAHTPEAAPPPAPAQPLLHRVVRGENLSFIAALYGVPVETVIAANPLPNPNLIYADQAILVPTAGSAGGP